jgi:hypothetical protein
LLRISLDGVGSGGLRELGSAAAAAALVFLAGAAGAA